MARSRLRRALTIHAGLVVSVGCQGDAGQGPSRGSVVFDSAGVRIVSLARPAPPDTLRFDPLWRYGQNPPEYQFEYVGDGILREDGVAVVADVGSGEVIAVAPGGNGHRILSRNGQGPTEVGSPRRIVRAGGERIWVEDVRNGKLLLFEGDSVASVLSGSANPTVQAGLMPLGVDEEEHLLMTTGRFDPEFEEVWLNASLIRFDPERGVVDTVGAFPLARRAREPITPFGPYGIVSVAGYSFVTARTDIPRITWRSSTGVVEQISRWEVDAVYPDQRDWEEFEAFMKDELARVNPHRTGEVLDELVDRQLARYELDESLPLPLFSQIHGGTNGVVWLAGFAPGGPYPARYSILSADGEWLAEVEFPMPFGVLAVTDDLVLGVHVDEVGVQSLAVYENSVGR